MTHPREGPMGRVRLADLALEVRDEGRGPPALLLHGFPTTNRLWDGVIPALRDAGLRCIAPDLAGYGLSESPGGEPGMERQAGWLTELLDALGVESALIVADGVYAGEWAMDGVESIQRWEPRNAARLAPVLARKMRSPGLSEESIRAMLAPYQGEEGGLRLIRAARALDPSQTASRVEALRAAGVPALVLWGESDRYLPIDTIARPLAQLLRAELRVLPGGHFIPAETPLAFAAEVIRFAKSLPERIP